MAGSLDDDTPASPAKADLCAVDDVPDGGSNGFYIDGKDGRLLYMVIRRGGELFVYANACPHTGMPLDFQPGRFLDAAGTLIQCSTHGARFRIEDGYCVSGPCQGDHLKSVDFEVRGGRVRIVPVGAPAPRPPAP